jgi:NADPH:quinone reductase-like Zn-dependent oxidoreductase
MPRAIELHRIRPTIDRAFKMEEIREAMTSLKSGQHFGKIVLIVGEL